MKIIQILKHILVPHDENDYKPHLLRELGVSILLFSSVLLLGTSLGSSFFIHKTVLGAEVAASVLIDLTNESRLAYNESPLLRSPKLDQAAQLKGNDMSSKEYFSHNSPSGVTPWHWFKEVGYNFLYAGENLAINFTDSSDVEKAWLNSPTHRANIMNVEFREIGMATVKGMYLGYPTIYIVQMFGTPAYSVSKTKTNTEVAVEPITKKPNVLTTKNSTTSAEATAASSTELTLVPGAVKGEASSSLEEVMTTQDMAVVKNTSLMKTPARTLYPLTSYSTWYEKILFKLSFYIDIIYKILIILIAFVLVSMILIEMRKQHFKHILYGLSLLVLLSVFVYINQGFF